MPNSSDEAISREGGGLRSIYSILFQGDCHGTLCLAMTNKILSVFVKSGFRHNSAKRIVEKDKKRLSTKFAASPKKNVELCKNLRFTKFDKLYYLVKSDKSKYKTSSTVSAINVGSSIILNASQNVFHFSPKVDFDLDLTIFATVEGFTSDISLIEEPSS